MKLRYQLQVTRKQVGLWLEISLEMVPIVDPPKPKFCVPFDPALPLAGLDGSRVPYSRTDQGAGGSIGGIQVVSEIPAGYGHVPDNLYSLLLLPKDPKVFIYKNPQASEFTLICRESDLPAQWSDRQGHGNVVQPKDYYTTARWIQDKPHIHLSRKGNTAWAKGDKLTKEEWEFFGRRVVTQQKLEIYHISQTAEYDTKGRCSCLLALPYPTLEQIQAEGMDCIPASTDGKQIYTGSIQILDSAKASEHFPFLAQLPKVKMLCPSYGYSGRHLQNSPENIDLLAKTLKTTTLGWSDGVFSVNATEDLDIDKIEGFFTCVHQNYGCQNQNYLYTSEKEAARLFIPLKSAKKTHILNNTKVYYVSAQKASLGEAVLLSDLAKCPKRNHTQERKQRKAARQAQLSKYSRLPRKWAQHTPEEVRKWQDIQAKVDEGVLVPAVLTPLFSGMPFTRQITDWLLENDPNAVKDVIESVVYCPPYRNWDELANYPKFKDIVNIAFPHPGLALSLIQSQRAQAAIVTEMI